jgi:hypothetical protein
LQGNFSFFGSGVSAYAVNRATGRLTSIGLNARHLAYLFITDPSGRFAYVMASDMLVYAIDQRTGEMIDSGLPHRSRLRRLVTTVPAAFAR